MVAAASGGARAVARCDALRVAPYSDMAGGLFRAYLTPAHRAALDQVGYWMVEAGTRVEVDPAGNLIGRYDGTAPESPVLLIGSHIDSVRDAGAYDGPLGIMLGIECVAALNAASKRLPFAIEVIAFGDEEGSRFPTAMLTSRAVAGTLDAALYDIVDANGVTLGDALRGFNPEYEAITSGQAIMSGEKLSIRTFHAARRRPERVLGYLETHIEQGPVLEAAGLAVGVVTGIAAQHRYQVQLTGTAGHAGTSSMPLRRDALAGAAEMMLAVEQLARDDASDLVATVGQISAHPGAANVIAGDVGFTIDLRCGDAARHERASALLLERLAAIADARGLDFSATRIFALPASPCDPALMGLLDTAVAQAGQPPMHLVSGAGHDAISMAALCPTAMLFIRCRGGVSHNPAEHVEADDAEVALQVMLGFIDLLGASLEPA